MSHTQIRIKSEYKDKLKTLADSQHRSMANMLEVLINKEIKQNKIHDNHLEEDKDVQSN